MGRPWGRNNKNKTRRDPRRGMSVIESQHFLPFVSTCNSPNFPGPPELQVEPEFSISENCVPLISFASCKDTSSTLTRRTSQPEESPILLSGIPPRRLRGNEILKPRNQIYSRPAFSGSTFIGVVGGLSALATFLQRGLPLRALLQGNFRGILVS